MGMDIEGRNPANEDGKYIRFNVWSWRPMLQICREVIEEHSLGLSTKWWDSNDGEGLTTQEDCNKLADAIEKHKAMTAKQFVLEHPTCRVKKGTGVFASSDYKGETESAYSVSLDHIKEFVVFLRNCGGFKIF